MKESIFKALEKHDLEYEAFKTSFLDDLNKYQQYFSSVQHADDSFIIKLHDVVTTFALLNDISFAETVRKMYNVKQELMQENLESNKATIQRMIKEIIGVI